MSRYRSINLRLWLPVIILGALILMMTFTSVWRYQQQTQHLEQDGIKLLKQRVDRDQRHIENLLRMHQDGLVAEAITELGALPDIEFVALTDETGKILHGTHPALNGASIKEARGDQDIGGLISALSSKQSALYLSADGQVIHVYRPVQLPVLPGQIRSDRVGLLVIEYSLVNIKAQAWQAVIKDSLVNFGIGTLVMLLMIWLLDLWLARPLSYLCDVVRKISLGQFDNKIAISGEGELADLAIAVSRMEHDLTRTREEQARSQKELEQFKSTLDQTLDGVIIARTEDFHFLYVNQGIQRQLGYTEAELLQMNPLAIKPEGDKTDLLKRMQPLLSGEVPSMSFESYHRHKNGTIFPVEIFLQLIHHTDDESRFVAIVRDISTRKQVEESLRESEARFRVLFEQAAVGVGVVNTTNSRFVRINRKYCEILGYSEAEMLSMDFSTIIYPEDLLVDIEPFEQLKRGEIREYTVEKRYIRKDGSICWVKLSVSPMWGKDRFDQHIAVVEDITARKHSEVFLSDQMEVLEMIARGDSLDSTLNKLINAVEAQAPDMLCSILLLDPSGKYLEHCAAPSLPDVFKDAINGSAIGPSEGSCGTAAFYGVSVVVTDIATDPLWKDFAHIALMHDLRACWSTPIFSANKKVLGTFAVYYKQPRAPLPQHKRWLSMATHTAAIAIERQQSEAALTDAAEYTQIILDNVADGIITTNDAHEVESSNSSAATIFGFSAEELIGQSIYTLIPDLRVASVGRVDVLAQDGFASVMSKRLEMEGQRKDGSLFPMELSVSRVLHNEKIKWIGLVSDISERRRHEEKIQRLAFYDPLTQLPNRRLLIDRLQRALATSSRSGSMGALLLLDLDHFKDLNDTHGHDAGDLLLCQVAERLTRCVREVDTVARLGGDEFVIVLEDLGQNVQEAATSAKTIGEHILSLLSQHYLLDDIEHFSSPSIGVTLFSKQSDTVDALLKRADVAMYQAKAAGRNTLQFFDSELQASLAARTALEADMRMGLVHDQFLLHYQPQVDRAGKITGAEALIRWQHPKQGMISPLDFIPLAEQSGFILPLGQWVLRTACKQLVVWSKKPETAHLTLAINVSARQFRQIGFVEQVMDIITQTGANPTLIKLELTESLLVNNLDDVTGKMRALKNCGVGFSLDDFGTGYSSLSYLRQLPLDQIKIDQSFVRDVLIDPNDAVIARTIIGLGLSLGLDVIAEGVETEGQRAFLEENGCYAYQGYLFARPLPFKEFEALLGGGTGPILGRRSM